MKAIIFYLFALLISSFLCFSVQCQTYNQNGTTYINGEYYKTTGQPKVVRSESAKKEFLRSLGYEKVPYGYQVDHIIPLSQGGTDTPSNMQLISIEQHKQKTASERQSTSSSSYSYPTYNSTSTGNSSNYSKSTSTSKTIYTGPKGGQYYFNSSGKKVYIKK